MTRQLTLWPDVLTSVQTLAGPHSHPWPAGVWLRAYTNSLRDENSTIIGRVTEYGQYEGETTIRLVNARGGAVVPTSRVVGVVSPIDGGSRTGFPKHCPSGYARPVNGGNCFGCEHRILLPRGVWYCNHREHQAAPGVFFCLGCGSELCPYFTSLGWRYCGGPTGRCMKEGECYTDDFSSCTT